MPVTAVANSSSLLQSKKCGLKNMGSLSTLFQAAVSIAATKIRKDKEKKNRYDAFQAENDANLTATECQELADLIMELFGPELDETKKNRFNRMMNSHA